MIWPFSNRILSPEERIQREKRGILRFNIYIVHVLLVYVVVYKLDATGDAATTVRMTIDYLLKGIGVGLLAYIAPHLVERVVDAFLTFRLGDDGKPTDVTKQTIITEKQSIASSTPAEKVIE